MSLSSFFRSSFLGNICSGSFSLSRSSSLSFFFLVPFLACLRLSPSFFHGAVFVAFLLRAVGGLIFSSSFPLLSRPSTRVPDYPLSVPVTGRWPFLFSLRPVSTLLVALKTPPMTPAFSCFPCPRTDCLFFLSVFFLAAVGRSPARRPFLPRGATLVR